MRTIGKNEQRHIDELAAVELGLSGLILMEHAAMAVVRLILEKPYRTVTFLCGKGNNGGDGYAAARLLLGQVPELRLFESEDAGDQTIGDAACNRQIALSLGIEPGPLAAYEPVDGELVVDALFGSAFTLWRGLPEEIAAILSKVSEARQEGRVSVLAVDLPSGVEADSGRADPSALKANRTISFVYPKTGIVTYPGRSYAGDITVDRIGLPQLWIDRCWSRVAASDLPASIDETEILARSKSIRREKDSHKGSNGNVLIMAGGSGMGGAAILSTKAAVTGGSGLTRLVVPPSLYAPCLQAVPSALVGAFPSEADEQLDWWSKQLEGQDAVAIGPGIGPVDEARPFMREMIVEAILSAPRLLLDADALNLLALPAYIDWGRAALAMRVERGMEAAVLTPHPGEAKRLLPEDPELVSDDRLAAGRLLAELWSSHIVLKGAGTLVIRADLKRVWINTSGNPGMGKGGSGDILSGLMLSFLGQSFDVETAIISAVYLHGRAADLAAALRGERGLGPEDTLQKLVDAYREVDWA